MSIRDMVGKKQLVFIVSGGRTGTHFLGDRLSTVIPDCHSVHEPDVLVRFDRRTLARIGRFGWWHMIFGRLIGRTGVRVLGMRRLTGRVSEARCRELIRSFRCRYHASISESLIVESNAQWWLLVDQLAMVWPRSRIVVVIRDPRTWVRSWLNRGGRYVRHDRADLLPPGRLTPAKVGDTVWADRWDSLGTFGKLAWEWKTVYGKLHRHVQDSANTRIYRYEDIFSDDPAPMLDLVSYVGGDEFVADDTRLAGFTSTVSNASTGKERDWPAWPNERARLLDEICGPLMRRYGYGIEAEWQTLLNQP